MKNLCIFFLISILTFSVAFSQESNKPTHPFKINKITGGGVAVLSGSTSFVGGKNNISPSYNLLPNICFITNISYHNILYGLFNGAFRSVNGFYINKNKDLSLYLTFGKYINLAGGTITTGIEKMIKAGNVNCFLYVETQANVDNRSETKDLQINVGIHANVQFPMYMRK